MVGHTVKATGGLSSAFRGGLKYVVMSLILALFAVGTLLVWPNRSIGGPKPHAGWLYVVDSKNGSAEAQVLLIDPTTGAVLRTFKTGMNPDIALAPDGLRLYIASTYTDGNSNKDQLAVVDTTTGAVLQTVDNTNRVSYNIIPPSSTMALSSNGRWLYLLKYETQTIGPESTLYWVETFDTQTGRFLPEKANLSTCGWGRLSASPRDREVQIICEATKDVRLLKITDTGRANSSVVELKSNSSGAQNQGTSQQRSDRAAGGFIQDDRNLAVMRDGRVLEVNNTTHTIKEVAAAKVPGDEWVHTALHGPDRSKVFMALSLPSVTNQGRWAAGEITEVNLTDSSEVGRMKTTVPFDYLSLSNDGRRLYAVSSTDATLQVIDATTLKEINVVKGLGISPSLVIEAP